MNLGPQHVASAIALLLILTTALTGHWYRIEEFMDELEPDWMGERNWTSWIQHALITFLFGCLIGTLTALFRGAFTDGLAIGVVLGVLGYLVRELITGYLDWGRVIKHGTTPVEFYRTLPPSEWVDHILDVLLPAVVAFCVAHRMGSEAFFRALGF